MQLAPGFGLDLYREIALAPGNLAFSPLSASAALAMAFAGARGETAREMAAVLRLPEEQGDAHAGFGAILGELASAESGDGPTLTIANRLWAATDAQLEEAFLALVRDRYRSDVGQADFGDAAGAARAINAWVKESTRDRIPEIVGAESLSAEVRLMLANAVYFLGAWLQPFNRHLTSVWKFWLDGTTAVDAHMMHQAFDGVLYAAGEGWEAVELPYRGRRLVMDVIKPTSNFTGSNVPPRLAQSLEELEASLTEASLSRLLASDFQRRKLLVFLPRFEIDASSELSQGLKRLGMKNAFLPGKADFSGAVREQPTWIDAVLHRCFVHVDEQGTEAAAVTLGGATGRASSLPPMFVANHPFLFLIRDTRTDAILFMGRVSDPTA